MKKQLFGELIESIREAGEIRRGQRPPSRKFVFKPDDVRSIREKLQKSQSEFAQMIGVTISTLQNWEQKVAGVLGCKVAELQGCC